MRRLLATLKPPLCSELPLASADGAGNGLIKHQLVGNFTGDIDELVSEATHYSGGGLPRGKGRTFFCRRGERWKF